jgi:hypothetical protein
MHSGQPVVISHEDVRRNQAQNVAHDLPRSAWLLTLVAPAVCISIAALSLWLFFQPHRAPTSLITAHRSGSPGFVNQLNFLSQCASMAGVLAVLVGGAGIWFAWSRGHMRRWWLQFASSVVFVIASVVCLVAMGYWIRTIPVRVSANWPVVVKPAPERPLDRRLLSSAVVCYREKDGGRHRPAIGSGVVIQNEGGRVWVIAVPPPTANLQDDIWVMFADRRYYEGNVRWHGQNANNLLLLEATIPEPPAGAMPSEVPGAVELQSWSDATVPGEELRLLSLARGSEESGSVIKRKFVSGSLGAYSLLHTNLEAAQSDVGSGVFDGQGRLVGVLTQAMRQAVLIPAPQMQYEATNGEKSYLKEEEAMAQVMTLSADVIRQIGRAMGAGSFIQHQPALIASNRQ